MSSFSAVSTPIFASKYSLESSRRDLHNALLCTILESIIENGEKRTWPKQPRKKEKTRKREAIKRSTASHLELQRRGLQEKIARENKKANLEFWLSGFQWSEIFWDVCFRNVGCPMELRSRGIRLGSLISIFSSKIANIFLRLNQWISLIQSQKNRILHFFCEFLMNFFRISRQIPEKSDVCRFFNQIYENILENSRKFWNIWNLFIIIYYYSLLFIRVLSQSS